MTAPRGRLAIAAGTARAGIPGLFSPGWPLVWLAVGYPLWWVIGISAFMPALLCIPIAWHLLRRWPPRIPRSFVIWIFLLAWIGLSATQLQTVNNFLSYAYRGSYYLMGGLAFLYVISLAEQPGALSRIVRALTIFWLTLIVLGLLAQLLPHVQFSSLVEPLIPADWLKNDLVRGLVHPRMANVQTVIGQPIARAAAPFPYTNWWGGNAAALVPFVLLEISTTAHARWRRFLVGALFVAVVPIVLSLNRGMWLSLAVGLTLAIALHPDRRSLLRRARAGVGPTLAAVRDRLRFRGFSTVLLWTALTAGMVVVGVLVAVLADIAIVRLTGSGSAGFRLSLSQRTVDYVLQSPWLGYGVPLVAGRLAIRIGTQGQLWLLLISAGIPALLAFGAWLIIAVRATLVRRATLAALWGGIVVVIVSVQMPFYNIINVELVTLMIGAALGWCAWGPAGRTRQSPV